MIPRSSGVWRAKFVRGPLHNTERVVANPETIYYAPILTDLQAQTISDEVRLDEVLNHHTAVYLLQGTDNYSGILYYELQYVRCPHE